MMARMKDVYAAAAVGSSSSGYANAGQEDEEEEDVQPFSFPMLLSSTEVQADELAKEQQRQPADQHQKQKKKSSLDGLREMYIDMDIALPCAWQSMKRQGSSSSSRGSSTDSQEFDFSMCLRALDPACETPADELFYKGQLIPLQNKMTGQDAQDDDEEGDEGEEGEEEAKADSFSFKAQCGLLPKELDLGSLSPDRFPTESVFGTPGLDSRSSSFRSTSSYWDSGDKDCVDSSSSCRDSNGSSQDSCFEAPSQPAADAAEEKQEHSKQNLQQQQQSKSSNWRKSPFKWKVLLGGSKRAPSASSSSSELGRISGQRQPPFSTGSERRGHSFTYGSSASSSGPLLGSFFTGVGDRPRHYRHSVSASASLSGKHHRAEQSSIDHHHSHRSSSSSSSSSSSKATEVIQKYLKILKPLYDKVSNSSSASSASSYSYCSSAASSQKSDQLYGPPPAAAPSPPIQARPRSLDDWRAAVDHHQREVGSGEKQLTCPSFLPGSLRVSSFSSRRSSTHASCVTSSRSSPNHSGVLSKGAVVDDSTVSELQSAIQGAIAHCKQSNTTLQSQSQSQFSAAAAVPAPAPAPAPAG